MKKISKWVVGNWKMNGSVASSQALVSTISADHSNKPEHTEVVLCPPAILLEKVKATLGESTIQIGGQDCHEEASGAYTGNISAPMLAEFGCRYAIVGHSERRAFGHEASEQVSKKASCAMENGLIPIICIGETLDERESGKAFDVVGRQVEQSLPDDLKSDFILAYEPVWAIGSGKIPSLTDIGQMHTHIIQVVAKASGLAESQIAVLYGGSVKAANSGEIMATDGVAGVLVGGASLKAEEFCGIIAASAG